MYLFFKSVAEAVMDKGIRGLVGLIPGAAPLYDIARSAWKIYRAKCKDAQQLQDIRRIVEAGTEEVKQVARQVASEVAAAQPEMVVVLETYLEQIPASVRQSLKRRDDPTGTSVPDHFSVRSADDMVKLLPPGLPRFRRGDALPGRPGWVLDRQLGIGGFGEVWLARHPQFHSLLRTVKFCRDLQTRDRDMLHEGKLIDRLLSHGTHANIVGLINVHLDGDAPWLMYEYVEAGDLADLIHQWAALPPKERKKSLSAN